MRKRKCATKFCRNRIDKNNFCNTCKSRKKRAAHPMRYAYDVLKMNAKRRGKPFGITFEYFKKFAIETNYLRGKGRTKLSYSVDCIKNHLGYVPGNLQCLTVSDNSKKGVRDIVLHYDWETKEANAVKKPVKLKAA